MGAQADQHQRLQGRHSDRTDPVVQLDVQHKSLTRTLAFVHPSRRFMLLSTKQEHYRLRLLCFC